MTGTAKAKTGPPLGLALVNVYFDTYWSRAGPFYRRPELAEVSADLHRLFGNAIGWAIRGAGEEEAMAEFKEAWEGKHAQWKHHLRFSWTGW